MRDALRDGMQLAISAMPAITAAMHPYVSGSVALT